MAGHGYHWENALAGIMATVSPNDSLDLPKLPTSGLYIGTITGGTSLTVEDMDGNPVQFKNLSAGQILPLKVKKVKASGTTVQDVIALY